jgi:hypothetical protein
MHQEKEQHLDGALLTGKMNVHFCGSESAERLGID